VDLQENLIKVNFMENLYELSIEESIEVNGGESFAYRAGQVMAVVLDRVDNGSFTSYGAIAALIDWFG
jgi:hypothetical protein